MSEILFIANDPCILALMESLQPMVETRINLAEDYSHGIRQIFDKAPAVVFMQNKIDDIPGQKLASQVKMLLDESSVHLVLLSDEQDTPYGHLAHFDAIYDLCLPFEELCHKVQQLLRTLPQVRWKGDPRTEVDAPATIAIDLPIQDDTPLPRELPGDFVPHTLTFDTLELPVERSGDDGLDLFAPLPEPFPPAVATAADEPSLPAVATAAEHVPSLPAVATAAESDTAPPLSDFFDDSFDIEPLPAAPAPSKAALKPKNDSRHIDRTSPNQLFGSMNEELFEQSLAASTGQNFRKGPPVTEEREMETGSRKSGSTGAPRNIPGRQQPPKKAGGRHMGAMSQGDDIPESIARQLGIKKKKEPRTNTRLIVAAVATVLLTATALVLWHQDEAVTSRGGVFKKLAAQLAPAPPKVAQLQHVDSRAPKPLPLQAPSQQLQAPSQQLQAPSQQLQAPSQQRQAPSQPRELPKFIPEVSADPSYAVSHPGWERYRADAVDYRIYREAGRIKAIQVVAEKRGSITLPFLKTCLRVSTGNEGFQVKTTERRSGIKILKGNLHNGGEVAVYRKEPEGDIRGFVLYFPSGV